VWCSMMMQRCCRVLLQSVVAVCLFVFQSVVAVCLFVFLGLLALWQADSVLQFVVGFWILSSALLQCVAAVCCSVLHCVVAVCCSMLLYWRIK